MRRQEKPNASYFPTFWLDAANSWLGHYELGRTTLRAFVVAAGVSRVKHTPLNRFPFDVELGLALGGPSVPSSGWRETLANNKPPAPTALNRQHFYDQRRYTPSLERGGGA